MTEVLLFIIGTLGLAFFSRRSLRWPSSHGFFRFVAAEEKENLARFGEAYATYSRTTKKFIPYLV
ncbi:hypothetical protein EDS67_05195 [candidate division KSB1 bacterium]|nr:MAG: hypothetical protein EDS67_05195 [candidate division KSB1 bacterium]MBC6951548.1 hypothetical protein [candidate division KSB1 bacterium]MCE7940758.1 hypothetical protein [Chlorobi bacterium CHB1]MDL1876191.1 hypothetical protein [Cytophagia bacterium CHB2]RIK79745.1 MAG: hypothetical protein DCC62_05030 [candidate division KSB1 bacterium]